MRDVNHGDFRTREETSREACSATAFSPFCDSSCALWPGMAWHGMAWSSPFCLLAALWPCLVFSQTYETRWNSALLRSRENPPARSDQQQAVLPPSVASFLPAHQLLVSICLSMEAIYGNFPRQKGGERIKTRNATASLPPLLAIAPQTVSGAHCYCPFVCQ